MLQVFHLDVLKVDQNVAHVAMAIHVYFECMFQMFLCFFRRSLQVFHLDVLYVSLVCYNYFIWMLYVFVIIFKSSHKLLQVFQTLVASVLAVSYECCKCFIWMFQK